MRFVLLSTPLLLLLASCNSPPKPPSVDASTKRPANAAAAVELQTCRSALQNTRILADESARLAESAAAAAARLAAQQRAASALATAGTDAGNPIYTVLFGYGSTQVMLPAAQSGELIERARSAPLVLLRGRTDGSVETPGESRIARERAAAVRAYLVQAGIDPQHIRTTYQPVGDNAADNSVPAGRMLNRRVEIELYRVPPRSVAWDAAQPS